MRGGPTQQIGDSGSPLLVEPTQYSRDRWTRARISGGGAVTLASRRRWSPGRVTWPSRTPASRSQAPRRPGRPGARPRPGPWRHGLRYPGRPARHRSSPRPIRMTLGFRPDRSSSTPRTGFGCGEPRAGHVRTGHGPVERPAGLPTGASVRPPTCSMSSWRASRVTTTRCRP
jgi:hypothetical protein